MSVKRELIKMLEANRGQAFSGQQLADSLGVTRAAVWKAVQALREQGYAVLAAPNRGYMLSEEDDILSEEGIRLFLSAPFKNCSVKVLPQVDSTNLYARKLFLDEKGDKAMIAANEQTHGRGRLGKSFFSPADTGLYISLVWKEKRSLSSYMPVTMAAAVAVCRVIGKFCEQPPKIKWVNDVYIGSQKVCGILTEAISDFESGMADGVIVGIGLNVRTAREVFPEDLKDKAVSLYPSGIISASGITRNELAGKIAGEVFKLSGDLSSPEILEEYRSRSMVLGKRIRWERNGILCDGKALSIEDSGSLKVETEEGVTILKGGEISIYP